MAAKRRQFTQEFKDSAVKFVTEQGYKLSEAARNHDINVSQLRPGRRNRKQSSRSMRNSFPLLSK